MTADIEVDVLVAGAGAAGMTAALVCALNGLDVLLCEKSSQVGGTTATSAGTIWVCQVPGQAQDAGFADDIPEARRYLDSIIGAATDDGPPRGLSDDRPPSSSSISTATAR
jgi:flavin-dependent dehydrogenase